jgi:hypothetical protein
MTKFVRTAGILVMTKVLRSATNCQVMKLVQKTGGVIDGACSSERARFRDSSCNGTRLNHAMLAFDAFRGSN